MHGWGRRALVGVVVASAALAGVAPGATAATVDECEELQPALASSGPGETVTLTVDCVLGETLFLPSHPITFQGGGDDVTLDGGDEVRILEGHGVGETTIRNLTFVNGNAQANFDPEGLSDDGNGGAIWVDGNSPITVEASEFYGNVADGSGGAIGAFNLSDGQPPIVLRGNTFGSATDGNSASEGGAVGASTTGIEAIDNTFTGNSVEFGDGGGLQALVSGDVLLDGNTFTDNASGFHGGGAALSACGEADVTDNVFEGNAVESTSGGAEGGGLYIEHNCALSGELLAMAPDPADFGLRQSGNRFTANTVSSTLSTASGGGELVANYDVLSTNDRYHDNSVTTSGGCCEDAEGGGLSAALDNADRVVARNLVATSNSVSANNSEAVSEGGGVYVGAESGGVLTLVNATIAANSAYDGSGIAGDTSDALELHNSIVHGNVAGSEEGEEISGFLVDLETSSVRATAIAPGEGRDVRFSVACNSGGDPLEGEGNVCEDPKLVDPAGGDVHQTAESPTLDAASNDLLDGLAIDYEGEARVVDGDGTDGARVDMGADERESTDQPPGGGDSHGESSGEPLVLLPQVDGKGPVAAPPVLASKKFRAARRGGSIVAAAPVGTRVTYTLDENATVRFTVQRARPGRRVGRRCVAPRRSNRARRACTRYVAVRGSFSHSGVAGTNSFKFTGRLGGRKLGPGRYRLALVATDAAGNSSAAQSSAAFRIVRR